MLRLAQKYGPEIFEERLLDYFEPQENNSGHDGWDKVTFGDCLNMATGLGSEGGYWTRADVNNWYYAYTLEDKMKHIFTEDNRPWGPGEKMVYNDEDMFILGVALDRYVKAREGADSGILKVLEEEVFDPIHVHNFCTTTTYTPDGKSKGMPHFAWGCLPTLDEMAKIARLLLNRGMHDGEQLLHRESCRRIFLETEDAQPLSRYLMSFWYADYSRADDGGSYSVPNMSGMGGNHVIMMPNGMVGLMVSTAGRPAQSLIELADGIRPFPGSN